VLANPSSKQDTSAVARFTAPNSGYYRVTTRFRGSSPYTVYPGPNYLNGTTAKVAVIHNGSFLMPFSDLSGFIGRAANGYTDSQSTGTAVYEYSQSMDLFTGDKIDAVVYNDTAYADFGGYGYTGPGWTQVDFTITRENTSIMGKVTAANLPGNPPVVGAKIIANGSSTYQVQTDVNGNYLLPVRPDTYEISVLGSGFTSQNYQNVTIDPGQILVRDFSLSHTGKWNLASDFSTQCNPFGQWTVGEIYSTTEGGTTPMYGWSTNTTLATDLLGTTGWNRGSGWWRWVGVNATGAPIERTEFDRNMYIEPNAIVIGGGDDYRGGSAIRWTAPDARVVKINMTLGSQIFTSTGATTTMSIMKNLVPMGTKVVTGFMGRAVNNSTDSIGPAPTATFETTLAVQAGDSFEFVLGKPGDIWVHWWPNFGWPERTAALWVTVNPGEGEICNTLADVKNQPVGKTVFMLTPVQLCAATVGEWSLDKRYGAPTTMDYAFYVQNDDRTQGMKCVSDGSIPTYNQNYKITFTGVIELDYTGQKVVRIQSINSAVAGAPAKVMGKSSKALTATGTLVRVWGKVKEIVNNPVRETEIWMGGDPPAPYYKWDYEYIVINDGGNDVKIPLHVQANYMTTFDGNISGLQIGDYIGVNGIAGTTNGTDVVVYPRNVADILNYTDLGM
jgi:hypothetical protein